MAQFLLALIAYCVCAVILFGGVLQPIDVLYAWSGRLGLSVWPLWVIVSFFVACGVAGWLLQKEGSKSMALASFVTVWMAGTTVLVGINVEVYRHFVSSSFNPDHEIRTSFFRSIRQKTDGHRALRHGKAIKDCVFYLWSYRNMNFYKVSDDYALRSGMYIPAHWIEECGMKRS